MIFISLNNIGDRGINIRRIEHHDMLVFSEYLAVECCKTQHRNRAPSINSRIKALTDYHTKVDDPMTPMININLGIVAIVELYRLAASIVARLAGVSASNCDRHLSDPGRKNMKPIVQQPEFEALNIMMDILEVFGFCVSIGTSVTLSQQATPVLARVH